MVQPVTTTSSSWTKQSGYDLLFSVYLCLLYSTLELKIGRMFPGNLTVDSYIIFIVL